MIVELKSSESPPAAGAFAARDNRRERKKDEKGRSGMMKGEGKEGWHYSHPRRHRPICPWLLTITSACGGGGGIRVLRADVPTERGVGLHPPKKGTGISC